MTINGLPGANAAATRPDGAVPAVTCLGCGCACDDITVVVANGRIDEARNACALGATWFGDGRVPGRALVSGRDVARSAALEAAAQLLGTAANPLVYLAPDVSCEAQRVAAAVADHLRATLDSVTSATAMPSILAAQERGRAGATLGELRHRADVLVYWGTDPDQRYPRYRTRYAPDRAGVQLPDGVRPRIVVAVDVGESNGPIDAGTRVAVPVQSEVAVLTLLADTVRRIASSSADAAMAVERARPLPDAAASAVKALVPLMLSGRYVAIVADAEPPFAPLDASHDRERQDPGRAPALLALAHALNGSTRAALSMLRAGGNRTGADAVCTSHTGYPAAIDFSRSYPRYRPYDGAHVRLAHGQCDGVLVIGSAALVPDAVLRHLAGLPIAVIGPRASESMAASIGVAVDTGVAGIHEEGMALRMDDVPLPLRAPIEGPPSAFETLRELMSRLREPARPARHQGDEAV